MFNVQPPSKETMELVGFLITAAEVICIAPFVLVLGLILARFIQLCVRDDPEVPDDTP